MTIFVSACSQSNGVSADKLITNQEADITVFTAKKIITMEPRYPEAKLVAVREGQIIAIGQTLEDLEAWTRQYSYRLDTQFEDKILMPGFIDPHLHPLLAGLFLPHFFATPDAWNMPYGTTPTVNGHDAFLARIDVGDKALESPEEWLLVFGWAQAVHGNITRAELDEITRTRPIAISSRSTHSMILNSKALEVLGLTAEIAAAHSVSGEVDYENGLFVELANFQLVIPRIAPVIFAPERIQGGLLTLSNMLHSAGVTTICEPGTGIVAGGGDTLKDLAIMTPVLDTPDVPFRTYLFPAAAPNLQRLGSAKEVFDYVEGLPGKGGKNIHILPKKIKFLYDGSYVDQLGIYDAPGYIDGHDGITIDPPKVFSELTEIFWDAGYALHVHVQGDGGARGAVNRLGELQEHKPRFDHRFVLEHLGQGSSETVAKAGRLGASVSALMYPFYSMGDPFSDKVLGPDRMEMAFPYRDVIDNGMHFALHADTPVAPPMPLRNAWVAVNRQTSSGRTMGKAQAISVHEALRAITSDAAYILGLENEIGSIRPGKKADFVVLESDPYNIDPARLKDIPIWGTIFEGKVQPVEN